jgi:DNA-directed RNA polymerase subunit beta'
LVKFLDIIEGVTMKQEVDETTGSEDMVIIEHKEDLHPTVIVEDPKSGDPLAQYSIPAGAHLVVSEGDEIGAGSLLAKTPRKASKTKDITGGLPRVAELFEARRPKDAAEISKIDGVVDFGSSIRGKRCVVVKDIHTGVEEEHLIPIGKHIIVYKGDFVKKGQQLTDGPVVPHEILDVCGPHELQEHLVNEIQEVYRLQGVTINDKHIEIIIRQMLRKVRITEPGDTLFLWSEQIDKLVFEEENSRVEKMGGKPAEAAPVLLGITKASLDRVVLERCVVPRHHPRPHRGGDHGQVRLPPRLQGECHHGSHHPGRNRLRPPSQHQGEGLGRGSGGRAGRDGHHRRRGSVGRLIVLD